jgi:hypothetical protein
MDGLTYVGSRGETVMDYTIVRERERVDSDHFPLEITIERMFRQIAIYYIKGVPTCEKSNIMT